MTTLNKTKMKRKYTRDINVYRLQLMKLLFSNNVDLSKFVDKEMKFYRHFLVNSSQKPIFIYTLKFLHRNVIAFLINRTQHFRPYNCREWNLWTINRTNFSIICPPKCHKNNNSFRRSISPLKQYKFVSLFRNNSIPSYIICQSCKDH